MDDILRNFNNRSRDFIKKLDISDEDKTVVEDIVFALINQDEDKLQDTLYPIGIDNRADYIQLANAVIDDLRLESENEIIQNGSLDELENLRELTEIQDQAMAATLDKITDDEDKAAAAAVAVKPAEALPVTTPTAS